MVNLKRTLMFCLVSGVCIVVISFSMLSNNNSRTLQKDNFKSAEAVVPIQTTPQYKHGRVPYLQRKRRPTEDKRSDKNVIMGIGRPSVKETIVASDDVITRALDRVKVSVLEGISSSNVEDIMLSAAKGKLITKKIQPEPVKIVIVSTWRSGSTFLEEIFNSHKMMFNFYEPLLMHGITRLRNGSIAVQGQNLIHSLLNCRFTDKTYLSTIEHTQEIIMRNSYLYKICNELSGDSDLCFNAQFLTEACKVFPWKVMKLVRLKLDLLESLMEDPEMYVILLVRDPRAIMNSRSSVQWCRKDFEDCASAEVLCQDMLDDVRAAERIESIHNGRVSIIKYEDFATEPFNTTKILFDRVGLEYGARTEEFITNHISNKSTSVFSTSKDSLRRVAAWKKEMSLERIAEIEEITACDSFIVNFNYNNT